jgi:hypothetical protein
MSGNQYFEPINLGGLQSFFEAGETGWYQFNVPGAVLPTFGSIVVPQLAQGMLVQAVNDVRYCFSPDDALAGTGAYLTLPAGGTIFLSGTEHVRQFCVLLGAGTATFTVQFYQGNIGPIPTINSPRSGGGVIPPPPPGLGAIITQNTIHVMKNGNDITGTRNRMDLPFLTVAAAEGVAQAGDTIVIWPGIYTDPLTIGDITYHLVGSEIYTADTAVDCNSVIMRITGNGVIRSDGNNPAVYVQNSGELFMQATVISGGDALYLESNSSAIIHGSISAIGSGVFSDESTLVLYGNVSSSNTVAVTSNRGSTTIWGDVDGDLTGLNSNDNTTIYGNVIGRNGIGCNCDGGTQTVFGKVLSETDYGANCTNGIQRIYGPVTTMATFGARCAAGAQYIYGNVTATATANGNAALCLGGNQYITGDVLHQGTGPALNVTGGKSEIRGNVDQTGNGFGVSATAGSYVINGNVNSAASAAARANGGTGRVNGDCTSNATAALDVTANSTLTFSGRARSTAANTEAATVAAGSTLRLLGDATIERTGTANSVTGSGTVRSFGAYANAAAAGGITIQGTLNILP